MGLATESTTLVKVHTIAETEQSTPIVDPIKVSSGNSTLNEGAENETPSIISITTEIAPCYIEIASPSVAQLDTEYCFSTPLTQSRTSSENEVMIGSDLTSNPFDAFQSGDFSGFLRIDDVSAQRSRGGRYIKPTQKIQKMQ